MSSIEVSAWSWVFFGAVVTVFLAMDLWLHRGGREASHRAAILWSIAWIGVGLAFGAFVWLRFGSTAAQEYLGAYLIEKSLSLDNLFVFLVIFQSLRIPPDLQRRPLFWGILGALAFRGLFVFLGIYAIRRWHAVVYAFGALLVVVAFRVARQHPMEKQESRLVKWLERHLPVTSELHGNQFVAHANGRWLATPVLVALLAIELTDIGFAIDSVPAAFAISREPYIVYTSNIFAILGLRALYIALAGTIAELRYLHYGLAAVLLFAGLKMLLSEWIEVPPLLSVVIIVILIGSAALASLRSRPAKRAPA